MKTIPWLSELLVWANVTFQQFVHACPYQSVSAFKRIRSETHCYPDRGRQRNLHEEWKIRRFLCQPRTKAHLERDHQNPNRVIRRR
jgi:hypothetical protein